jgi:ABC-type oligopeptide transport system ATPase subunit
VAGSLPISTTAPDDSFAVSFDSVKRTYQTKTESVNALDGVSFRIERGAVSR